MTNDDKPDQAEEESGVSWTIVAMIVVIFLCFTIIPALIFFMDRSAPPPP